MFADGLTQMPKKSKTVSFTTKKKPKSRRILLVDDDKFLLEFFARVLTAQGFVIVLAANGLEAEEVLKTDKKVFDLVVVDLLMPMQNGWRLIDFIKASKKHQNMPIIALTGLSLSYEEYERTRRQTDAVLLKGDFEISRFTETINKVLLEKARK